MGEIIFGTSLMTLNTVRFGVKLLSAVGFLLVAYVTWQLLCLVGAGWAQLRVGLRQKNLWAVFSGALVCMGLLSIFAWPQDLVPKGEPIEAVFIQNWQGNGGGYLEITEQGKIEEFLALIGHYQCRKSVANSVVNSDEMIEVDLVPRGQGETIHLVLTKGSQARYTDLSEEFIYTIDDHKNELYQKISHYMAQR